MAKSARNTSGRKVRRRKTRKHAEYGRDNTYSHSIYKLLKCMCPELSISVLGMNIMNSFIEDLLERIASEASKLVHYSGKTTMGSNDILSATKLVITTPMLCKYAIEMARRTIEYTAKNPAT